MKTYIKFIIKNFSQNFIYVLAIMLCLIFIFNLLSELDFFKNLEVSYYYPIYLSLLNSPSHIFEILPFIILITTQFFFIGLFNKNEMQIFKYSGLKNTKILSIILVLTLIIGFFAIAIFYSFSSNLKKIYLVSKSNYTSDGKYLAVITKNGLWIKDKNESKNLIINSNKLEKNFLIDAFITELSDDFVALRSIKSKKIDITNKEWVIFDPIIYINNSKKKQDLIKINTNFDYAKIQSLFSNLNSLSFFQLLELKKNYIALNYSTTEVNVQIQKILSYPFYLSLMTLISGILMFNVKNLKSYTLITSLGFMLSVIIYYLNNFFNVLGSTEKISYISAVWSPLVILTVINLVLILKINEK